MRRLPFTRRRVAFRCGLFEHHGCVAFQCGVVVGHYVARQKLWFGGESVWVRYYSVQVCSGPVSVRGTVVQCLAEWVFRWPVCEAVPQC